MQCKTRTGKTYAKELCSTSDFLAISEHGLYTACSETNDIQKNIHNFHILIHIHLIFHICVAYMLHGYCGKGYKNILKFDDAVNERKKGTFRL